MRGRSLTVTLFGEKESERRTAVKNRVVVLSKAKDKSFADMVRGLRTGLGERKDVVVKQMRKTKSEGMVLELDGGREMAEEVRRIVSSGNTCVTKAVTKGGVPRKIISLIDMYVITTVKDVMNAIEDFAGRKCEGEVKDIRPSHGGKIAREEVELCVAERLIRRERLMVGIISCLVKERVSIARCHRCQAIGHIRAECKAESEHKGCWRCGEEGHIARQCNESKLWFANCNIEGHRCQELVDEARSRSANAVR
ncbi:uncharacterized protein LOC126880788 [Diabrotica virgifera virgifera]|uniref:CCHC-type domain-containing protein n=1 Tax=Diabrotica virgifera virgifera TaxID=50390 RepID=A0ABM5JS91_DIAVI|nr:uncharacterized protein LOC126880788 [Diabrotica virgifera virgifera]